MSETHYERLSALDASFLDLESEYVHSHVGTIGVFDAGPLARTEGGIDFDQVLAITAEALERAPRLRQKIARMPVTQHPVWVDDRRFDLRYHVRHASLPNPGNDQQLKSLVGRIISHKLDLRKPLWEFWIVEGLEGGRFALVAKVHHCLVDGISGVELMGAFVRTDPDQRARPAERSFVPRRAPLPARLLADEIARRASLPLRTLQSAARALAQPERALEHAGHLAAGLVETLTGSFPPASPTPFNVEIGAHRRFDWTRFDLGVVQEVRARFGGTLNDVVLACVAGAVRRYLHDRGIDTDSIDFRAVVPVSRHGPAEQGRLGNRVSMLVTHLPVDEPDPRRRFARVVEETRRLKASGEAEGAEAFETFSDWTVSSLLSGVSRLAAERRSYNLIVTNVPGPPMPVYMNGAQLLASYPLTPIFSRQALGIALMSYHGSLYWGFNADWDALRDLREIVRDVDREFERLRKL